MVGGRTAPGVYVLGGGLLLMLVTSATSPSSGSLSLPVSSAIEPVVASGVECWTGERRAPGGRGERRAAAKYGALSSRWRSRTPAPIGRIAHSAGIYTKLIARKHRLGQLGREGQREGLVLASVSPAARRRDGSHHSNSLRGEVRMSVSSKVLRGDGPLALGKEVFLAADRHQPVLQRDLSQSHS